MISHIEFAYRNLCKGVQQISKFKLQDLYLRGRVIRVENKSSIIEMIIPFSLLKEGGGNVCISKKIKVIMA